MRSLDCFELPFQTLTVFAYDVRWKDDIQHQIKSVIWLEEVSQQSTCFTEEVSENTTNHGCKIVDDNNKLPSSPPSSSENFLVDSKLQSPSENCMDCLL